MKPHSLRIRFPGGEVSAKGQKLLFEHDNHDNLFLMNNVFFFFRTRKHNTECFFISFRARKKSYDYDPHFSGGQCLFERSSNIS